MANVKKWMHWCCERPIIKKMVNAKKQTQCYNTKRWCKNADGDDAQMRHKCKT
jgi:hypothetical protein